MADLVKGTYLFNGDPFSLAPAGVTVKVPALGRGWAWLHVLTAAHASDTTTVAVSGRLSPSANFTPLKQSDQSTVVSVAQVAGALKESIISVQLMPEMKVVLSGTATAGASTKVWLEALTASGRADS